MKKQGINLVRKLLYLFNKCVYFFKFSKVYNRFKSYTMIPKETYIENLRICQTYSYLKGEIIECGTWKGGMIAGMAEILGNNNRTYYLFDSFEGLPSVKEIDGEAALEWQKNTDALNYFDNCKTEINFAREAMKLSKACDVVFFEGWFSDTLPKFRTDKKIAILRLDGDWYDSILICMEYLFPYVVHKGLIIIDDYYIWDGTSKAIHDYLSKIKSSSKINKLHGGVAYIIKED
jgi:O-methyltransferase